MNFEKTKMLSLFLSLLVTGCVYLDSQAYVEGKFIDEQKMPIEGVAVSIDGYLMTTDENGCFEYDALTSSSQIVIEATKRGKQYIHKKLPNEYNRVYVVLKGIDTPEPSEVKVVKVDKSRIGSYTCKDWGS